MSYFSMHAYDADVWIREFRGLNQDDESMGLDPMYASETLNVETPRGVLQPNAGYTILDGEFESRVETLASFHRRWYTGEGSKNWMICAAGGQLYAKQQDSTIGWLKIDLPVGTSALLSNVWSWVTYEDTASGTDYPVDVLLMSNDQDGMIMVTPPDRYNTWQDALDQNLTWENPDNDIWEDEPSARWQITFVDTRSDPDDDEEPQKKFAVIERFAERIWGAGVPGEPDTLYYSRPYAPTDWTPAGDDESPEDGAGEIQQPSWDGDSFSALKAFGNQLIAFKRNRVWRISGTDPGIYQLYEQYGGGAQFANTIAVDGERIIMASKEGPSVYDGMNVSPYARGQISKIWQTVNMDAVDQMCGALFKNRYYLAFPVNGSEVNNAFLVFNNDDGTILYYEDMQIESLMPSEDYLYATSSTLPGQVLKIGYDSWMAGKCSGAEIRWVSPWLDFGYKRIQKGGFDLYFLAEVQQEAVTLKFSIETEKKRKTKLYTVERSAKEHRMKRIHFGGAGRKFRIIIEQGAGNKAPWRLIGGLQLVVETDPD